MYVVPLIIALSVRSYITVLSASVCSELMNCLLKWLVKIFLFAHTETFQIVFPFAHFLTGQRLIAEDRPYWWVMETNAYTMFTRPTLRQTYLTCETSAGSPSGHSMLFATILFVAMQESLQTMPWYRTASPTIKYCTWNIFISLLTLVAISRMYFACHFLHQCLLGVVLGIFAGHIVRQPYIQQQWIDMRVLDALIIGIALLLLMVVVYFGQMLLHVDPQWSVRKVCNAFSILLFPTRTQRFLIISGIQLVQRPVFCETRNDAHLRIGSALRFTIRIDIVCTARQKVKLCRVVRVGFRVWSSAPRHLSSESFRWIFSDATTDWNLSGASQWRLQWLSATASSPIIFHVGMVSLYSMVAALQRI